MDEDYTLGRLKKIDILPTFPDTVGAVMNVMQDPMSSASDLAKTMDPSMVSEVLRIANTAYFGTRNFRNISSIEHAIAIIGLEYLSSIIIQMPFISMVGNDTAFDREKYVKHSIMCGVLSKIISSSTHHGNPNEVYIGGMMHDIGSIIIYRYFRKEWDRVSLLVHGKGVSWIEAEKEVLAMDHGRMGAMLLELWNIPQPITGAIMYHHNPGDAGENHENAAVIYLGNKFAKLIGMRDDFASFDDFLIKYRPMLDIESELNMKLAPSDEVIFFEKIYSVFREIQGHRGGTAGDKDD